jgi:hypothetical protein
VRVAVVDGPAVASSPAPRDPTVPAPSRPTVRTPSLQRGSALAQLALLLASIGVIALAVLQVVRH